MKFAFPLALFLSGCSHVPARTPSSEAFSAKAVCRESFVRGLDAAEAAQAKFNTLLQSGTGAVDEAIYTPARRSAVEALFNATRESHARFLEGLSRRYPNPLFPEMIARVRAAVPLLDLRPSPNASPEYGARVLLRASSGEPDQVFIPGVALLVDTSPQALRLMILHEISHLIDPRVYAVPIEGSSASPWGPAVQCLRSPVSVAARAGGANCKGPKLGRWTTPKLLEFCAAEAAGLRANPDFTDSGPYCGCPLPQGAEAFADWLAAEVFAATESNAALIASSLAWPCSVYLGEEVRNAGMDPQVLEQLRAADVHPKMEDRLEKIFFVQPKFRDALKAGTMPGAAFYCPFRNP